MFSCEPKRKTRSFSSLTTKNTLCSLPLFCTRSALSLCSLTLSLTPPPVRQPPPASPSRQSPCSLLLQSCLCLNQNSKASLIFKVWIRPWWWCWNCPQLPISLYRCRNARRCCSPPSFVWGGNIKHVPQQVPGCEQHSRCPGSSGGVCGPES